MIQTEKQICEMDYDELNELKTELEQHIEEMEESLKEHNYVLSHVIVLINKMDAEED